MGACFLKAGALICLLTATLRDVQQFSNSTLVKRFVYLAVTCPSEAWATIASWPNLLVMYTDLCCYPCSSLPKNLSKVKIRPPRCECHTNTTVITPTRLPVIWIATGVGGGASFIILVGAAIGCFLLWRHHNEDHGQVVPPEFNGHDDETAPADSVGGEGEIVPANPEESGDHTLLITTANTLG